MKKILVIALMAAAVLSGCIKDDHTPGVTITGGQTTQTVFADQNSAEQVKFTTTAAWISSITETGSNLGIIPNWIRINPASGDVAGSYTINIALDCNYTGADRTATITITSCGDYVDIIITQKGTTSDGEPLRPSVTVGEQSGELKAEATGTATFAVTTAGIADGKEGTVAWFTEAEDAEPTTAPAGITATVSTVADNAATITVTATAEVVMGTYYFKTTIDTTTSAVATLTVANPALVPLVFTYDAKYDIPAMTLGTAITEIDLLGAVSGGRKLYIFSAEGLPAGITISKEGVISGTPTAATSMGTATITVTDNSIPEPQTESITIDFGAATVAVTDVTGVKLRPTSLSLTVGENRTLTAIVIPINATNKVVWWESSNTAVATVSTNGKVTAVKEGTATITVTTDDGGETVTCAVTVDPEPEVNILDKIPDAAFREYVAAQIGRWDTNKSGIISLEEAAVVTSINVGSPFDGDRGSIVSLAGIEYFTALKSLKCYYNKLETLDVSNNTKLTYLDCFNNELEELNVSGCNVLKVLYCEQNQLKTLDVSNNTALTELICNNNLLEELNVLGCTALTQLWCNNNLLKKLDILENIALTDLNCMSNPGDGVSKFPVTAWFDDIADIPSGSNFTKSSWMYDGIPTPITVDYRLP